MMKRIRQVGSSTVDLNITGYFIPFIEGQPVIVSLPDLPDEKFVTLFSSLTNLRGMMVMWHASYDSYITIIDPEAFLDGIREIRKNGILLRIMVDAVASERATTRFKEIAL